MDTTLATKHRFTRIPAPLACKLIGPLWPITGCVGDYCRLDFGASVNCRLLQHRSLDACPLLHCRKRAPVWILEFPDCIRNRPTSIYDGGPRGHESPTRRECAS